ncbi:MAG TPA: DUF2147 domain-containing protein [Gammaproteobacteria bacterium]|nr:DUF2147 domain-containing protein [Gammaproteobacteria bacterium]
MRAMLILTAALAALIALPVAADSGDSVLGMWMADDGKARVEIVREGDLFNGRIVWLKEPMYPADDDKGMAGLPKVDRENPDKTLQTRPIIGLLLVQGFKYAGDNVWSNGTIYDPESGKTYKCSMTLKMDGTLKVRGYIGISLFGETRIWTRPVPTGDAASSQP